MFRLHSDVTREQVVLGEVSRRTFLRSSALLMACGWALGFAGCGEEEEIILGPVGTDTGGKQPPPQQEPPKQEPPEQPAGVEVKMANALKNIGGTQKVEDKKVLRALNTDNGNGKGLEPLLLVRVHDNIVAANTLICTHQQCQVAYNKNAGTLDCPCHGSRYDLNGTVIQGPAPRSLKHFKATIQGDLVLLEA